MWKYSNTIKPLEQLEFFLTNKCMNISFRNEDDFIYFLPVAATSLRAGFQVYLSKLWVVDVTKEVRYDLSIYCLLSDIILSFLLVAATSLRAGFHVYLS